MFYPLGKNSEKPYGGVASTPSPPPCTSGGKKKLRFSKLKTQRGIAYRERLDKLVEIPAYLWHSSMSWCRENVVPYLSDITLPKDDETVFVICSSKLRVESPWSPWTHAKEAIETSLPSRVTWKSAGSRCSICRVPSTINLVLSGLIKRLLQQHQDAIFDKSSLICWTTLQVSLTKKMTNRVLNHQRMIPESQISGSVEGR